MTYVLIFLLTVVSVLVAAALLRFLGARKSTVWGGRALHHLANADYGILSRARAGHRQESLVRSYLNEYCALGQFAENARLPWLNVPDESSPNGFVSLELDGYNADLKKAFEYNGPLHYTPPRGEREFLKWLVSRHNDMEKRRLARENGVAIMEFDERCLRGLRDYVCSRLQDQGALREGTKFVYIKELPPKPILYQQFLEKITSIRRFGPGAPVIVPDPRVRLHR